MMYKVMSVHYGHSAQTVAEFASEEEARRFLAQQAAILKGYHKRTGTLTDGRFIVFGKHDIFRTQLWITSG